MRVYYPVFLDVEGRRCVVVGGGDVAARKARALAEAGARVLVVAPVCVLRTGRPEAGEAVRAPGVEVRERPFESADLEGVWLVVAATDDREVNRRVSEEAAARGLLCNVVDDPEGSSFIAPAVLRRGRLTVAVSTGGASPAAARNIRDEIARRLGEGVAEHLDFLAGARRRVKRQVRDAERRRAILERLARPDVRRRIAREGAGAAEALLAKLVAAQGEREGAGTGRRPRAGGAGRADGTGGGAARPTG